MDVAGAVEEISERIRAIPGRWDGKQAVLELREADYQWKQMEWIGWYFEHLCQQHLGDLMEIPGPAYGNVGFDGLLVIPWDFKAHSAQSGSDVVVNDTRAVEGAIREFGGVGVVLATGDVEYDEDGSFKAWHDELKGNRSRYEVTRMKEGRPSRKRKVSFTLQDVNLMLISRANDRFHQGRNADGSPRKPKHMMDLKKGEERVLRTVHFR